ncbi:hypothetical protein HBI56_147990 [Parastagonospora nodorum]|nr:hypothetical protein HBH77_132510 [Parastagonospora nodorum]KAH5715431.1 hypothetical protein HBI20_142320 [Parastagonospora nodorum]KAH5776613.1 hypothetical protein HBI16_087720 [Parastagonospora nodorum]KAH6499430.1 hypothetical protein HBI55_068050 [Parastagonospora nodorum]KAH6507701.1 hypothetical protein HBI56_147990 [Parastagonospora nodorum]
MVHPNTGFWWDRVGGMGLPCVLWSIALHAAGSLDACASVNIPSCLRDCRVFVRQRVWRGVMGWESHVIYSCGASTFDMEWVM